MTDHEVSPVSSLHLADLTWPEFDNALADARVAVLSVGAHEQHGPHLAFSTDIAGAEAFAKKLVAEVAPLAFLVPPIPFGVSYHHMHFPGTITLRPDTFMAVVIDIAESLKAHGIRRLFVVNGHGGNRGCLDVLAAQLRYDLGVRMHHATWPLLGMEAAREEIKGHKIGHACIFETSIMMHLCPHLVRDKERTDGEILLPQYGHRSHSEIKGFSYFEEVTTNGAFTGAREASARLGKEITDRALVEAAGFLREFALAELA